MNTLRYEFRLAERLSPTASAAFPELCLAAGAGEQVLVGELRDRSELHAVLARFDLMGLTILDVHRLPEQAESPANPDATTSGHTR